MAGAAPVFNHGWLWRKEGLSQFKGKTTGGKNLQEKGKMNFIRPLLSFVARSGP